MKIKEKKDAVELVSVKMLKRQELPKFGILLQTSGD